MAMSFTRPDPSSPASVADAGFSTSRRGFDQAEVRDFLRMIAAELGRLQERERFLERELRTAQTNPDLASAQLDEATLTRLLGEETARVLTTARESANEIRQKAEQAAAQLLSEAGDEAARLREEAEIESSRRRSDAASDAEAELSMAKQQGREMVNEARAYRERVLSELARRRELAREQIEQLLHGRDRLMQSFERARLVAVDVVAELQPLGEPDEYVNLAPTTGPVPVMVPNSPRPIETASAVSDVSTEATSTDDALDSEPAVDLDAGVEGVHDSDSDQAVAETAEVDVVDVETIDDHTTDETVDDVTVEAETVEADGSAAADEPDERSAAERELAATPAMEDHEPSDDVVVDLFARLRAESATVEVDEPHTTDSTVALAPAVDDAAGANEQTADEQTAADPEPSPFERRDADLTPLIVSAARKLKRVLADEQNEVLEALRSNVPVTQLQSLLPDVAEHLARYTSAIADELGDAARAGADLTSGGARSLSSGEVGPAIAAGEAVLAEWLVAPLRERVTRCVADGAGDNAAINKRVRAVYREWKTQHIDEQLDDIVRMAHGAGGLAGVDAGCPVVWVCEPGHQACADCDDNSIGGAVAAGESFPTGQSFAPAHIGCRCLLLPDGS